MKQLKFQMNSTERQQFKNTLQIARAQLPEWYYILTFLDQLDPEKLKIDAPDYSKRTMEDKAHIKSLIEDTNRSNQTRNLHTVGEKLKLTAEKNPKSPKVIGGDELIAFNTSALIENRLQIPLPIQEKAKHLFSWIQTARNFNGNTYDGFLHHTAATLSLVLAPYKQIDDQNTMLTQLKDQFNPGPFISTEVSMAHDTDRSQVTDENLSYITRAIETSESRFIKSTILNLVNSGKDYLGAQRFILPFDELIIDADLALHRKIASNPPKKKSRPTTELEIDETELVDLLKPNIDLNILSELANELVEDADRRLQDYPRERLMAAEIRLAINLQIVSPIDETRFARRLTSLVMRVKDKTPTDNFNKHRHAQWQTLLGRILKCITIIPLAIDLVRWAATGHTRIFTYKPKAQETVEKFDKAAKSYLAKFEK